MREAKSIRDKSERNEKPPKKQQRRGRLSGIYLLGRISGCDGQATGKRARSPARLQEERGEEGDLYLRCPRHRSRRGGAHRKKKGKKVPRLGTGENLKGICGTEGKRMGIRAKGSASY